MFSIALTTLSSLVVALIGFTLWKVREVEARHSPSGNFVAVPGGRLHYVSRLPAGAGGRVVLLIHGASGNSLDMVVPLADKLTEKGFRVIAFDRPGLGWSDRMAAETPLLQADAISAGLRALGPRGVIVVGHSLGGAVAESLALDHADMVEGLVLISTVSHPWPGGAVDAFYKVAATPVLGDAFAWLLATPFSAALMERGIAAVFSPQSPPVNYAETTGLELVLRPSRFTANARDVSGLYDFVTGQAPRLAGIGAPTVVIAGDRDDIVLTNVHSVGSARDIPGATLELLPGVGHSPHWTRPDTIIDAIMKIANVAAKDGVTQRSGAFPRAPSHPVGQVNEDNDK